MNFKLLLSIFAFITLLSILGCSRVETNNNPDIDNKTIKDSNEETIDHSPNST